MIEIQSEGSDRFNDVVTRHRADHVINHKHEGSDLYLFCANKISLHINILTNDIIRFRYSIDSEWSRDFSYAIDTNFSPDEVDVKFQATEMFYIISTDTLLCRITKQGMLVAIFDHDGNVLCEDDSGFYQRESIMEGISNIKLTKKAPEGKEFFGLGDKPCSFNLRGKALENWCTDAFGFQEGTDHMYRAIPFYYALHEGRAYGIFLDNTFKTRFSFDRRNNNVSSFSANGGEINYYFINGPQLEAVSQRYMTLTGKPELPPLWAFGFHQCRWSYFPEKVVRDLADGFRSREIPCDAIYLDIDYMDEYRCFTWNKEIFPNPTQLISDLEQDGFQTVVMIDPGIKTDPEYHVYKEGREKDVFCKRADGMVMKGPVWPEECAFPDYTDPKVRKWWGGLYEDFYKNMNISGFWNDMNEPAVFEIKRKTFPDSVRHNFDGQPCSHKKAHNIYGLQMSRATQEGLKDLKPEKRPFVLTRATFSGGQRYAAAWTGDNVATWEHLQIANVQAQRMSISGFSMIGSDIGGFADMPTPELFARWLQLGVFHPFFRVHSMWRNLDGGATIDHDAVDNNLKSGRVRDQEPWSYGDEYTIINKQTIEFRYQLLPYLYTAFWNNTTKGSPVLKSLSFYDQEDTANLKIEEEFIFGNQILVSPVTQPDTRAKKVYLPKGLWYNFHTSEMYKGQQKVQTTAPLAYIPMFVKAGTVLPLYPVMQYTNEKAIETLTLHVYYLNGKLQSELYEDAGDGYDYENGAFSLKTFDLEGDANSLTIHQSKSGSFEPSYTSCKVILHADAAHFVAKTCMVDGKEIAIENDAITIKSDFKTIVWGK